MLYGETLTCQTLHNITEIAYVRPNFDLKHTLHVIVENFGIDYCNYFLSNTNVI